MASHSRGYLTVRAGGIHTEIRGLALDPRVPVVSWPGFDDSSRPLAQHRANALRLAACWNALVDVVDPEGARDALDACEAVLRSFAYAPGCGPGYYERAKRALAKAKGAAGAMLPGETPGDVSGVCAPVVPHETVLAAFDSIAEDPADYAVVEAMEELGGSFIRSLAECWRRADPCNKSILKYAFAAYWRDYERKAASMTARAERRRGTAAMWDRDKRDPRTGGVDVTAGEGPVVDTSLMGKAMDCDPTPPLALGPGPGARTYPLGGGMADDPAIPNVGDRVRVLTGDERGKIGYVHRIVDDGGSKVLVYDVPCAEPREPGNPPDEFVWGAWLRPHEVSAAELTPAGDDLNHGYLARGQSTGEVRR